MIDEKVDASRQAVDARRCIRRSVSQNGVALLLENGGERSLV